MKKIILMSAMLIASCLGMEILCDEPTIEDIINASICLPDGECSTDRLDLNGAAFEVDSCADCDATQIQCCNRATGQCSTRSYGDCTAQGTGFVVSNCDECSPSTELGACCAGGDCADGFLPSECDSGDFIAFRNCEDVDCPESDDD
ncbi:MAG: hypothetical protein MI923_15510 [Phycisphaerales bacterium]|nr:hypothetical protein [Phycisphaerales bacterium]